MPFQTLLGISGALVVAFVLAIVAPESTRVVPSENAVGLIPLQGTPTASHSPQDAETAPTMANVEVGKVSEGTPQVSAPSSLNIPTVIPSAAAFDAAARSEEHTSELQSHVNLVC